ncbi:MAG: hypothetical protein DI537_10440 [Stutzerimonas stutzeri]|nr:MAG: hypothetical protein DI537_10440 [Stutzerimonas stutzeri]
MAKNTNAQVPVAALRWIVGEHVGSSSMAIFAHMTGVKPRQGFSNPWDPSDFGRCLRLLRAVPEWRVRLPEMARRSKAWKALCARWSEIERCMEEEVGLNWEKSQSAPRTYELMKEIIDGPALKKAA